MKHTLALFASLLLASGCCRTALHAADAPMPDATPNIVSALSAKRAELDTYNVVWDSPSKDANGSMPLGNGDVALNAWVEPTGDLVFYIGKTDSWDDNARLLKVGKVRVTLKPAPPISPFRQELCLADGAIHVRYGDGTRLQVWVDANHPVIHVAVAGQQPTTATAAIKLWRTERYELPSIEGSDVMMDRKKPKSMHAPTIVEPDTIVTGLTDQVGWYHHNIKSVGPAIHAETQGMTGFQRADPLLHRTFGAIITSSDAKRLDDTRLQSAAGPEHRFDIYVLTQHPSSPAAWLHSMNELIALTVKTPFEQRQQAHTQWWQEFWKRSWIRATAAPSDARADDAAYVSQMFALQRFITACAGRGRYPIKFNGSLFTGAFANRPGDADYRRWGPAYWWQNTRLPYISMCANGDFEMMEPLFRMYVDELLPLNTYRTKHYFGYDNAAYYAECIQFWGDVNNESYGWQPMAERSDPLQKGGWHKWEWVAGLELVWMLLDNYDYTGNETLLRQRILPTADAVLRFFDSYYKTNAQGQLVMHPSQALETWWNCTNPMPELAGLRAVTARLLALPESATPPAARAYWKTFSAKLPPLPTRDVPGGKAWAPAEKFEKKSNSEQPELYAVFPFRLCSFEKDNRELGVQALNHRWNKGNSGWQQGDIFMAYLGLAEEARQAVVARARSKDKNSRFPAFWGPNHDWIPDQDHGGVLMKAFQSMLMQTDGDKIFLLPAWPKTWDVNFKLHAPHNTTVEGIYRASKLEQLKVTPESRRKDVVIVQ